MRAEKDEALPVILIFDRLATRREGHFSFQVEYIREQLRQYDPEIVTSELRLLELIREKSLSTKRMTDENPHPSLLLMPTARARDLQIAVSIVENQRVRVLARVLEEAALSKLEEGVLISLRKSVSNGDITLTTETKELKFYISDRFDLSIERDWLIPMRKLSAHARQAEKEIRVSLVGAPRHEKGFHRIKKIRESLVKNYDYTDKLIIFEYSDGILKVTLGWVAALLRRATGAKVLLRPLPHATSAEAYEKRLLRSDIILLPYSSSKYLNRGSGVLLEAIYAERPIIVTDTVGFRDLTNHGNSILADTDDELASAIKLIVEQLTSFRSDCVAARLHLEKEVLAANQWLVKLVESQEKTNNLCKVMPKYHSKS